MAEVIKKRCERGHFYDAAVFVSCPHCLNKDDMSGRTVANNSDVASYAQAYIREMEYGEDPVTEARPRKSRKTAALTPIEDAEQNAPQSYQKMAEDVTIGFSSASQKDYFVTGWLVCVDGPDRGHTFNLHYGYNTMGKSRSNQICLLEETAKKVHCSVVYEDRKNRFFLFPEEGAVTWLNGTELNTVQELKTGDSVRVAGSLFEFIAFCRAGRKWERKDFQRKI